MESKGSVHVALRQWNSAQRSPRRTSSFHHIRRSNSGYVRIFAFSVAFGSESILLSLWRSECPEFLDPFPLCLAFPDSLDGRNAVEYYGSAAPPLVLAAYSPILCRKPWEVPALLTQ
jgi:hypothetical protein